MQQYRNKPEIIEPVQWDGTKEGAIVICDFITKTGREVDHTIFREGETTLYVATTENICYHIPKEGWVYPKKGDIKIMSGIEFAETYEPVSAPSMPRPNDLPDDVTLDIWRRAASSQLLVQQEPKKDGPWHWAEHVNNGPEDCTVIYEITNGKASILTSDCVDVKTMDKICETLDASELDFYQDSSSEFVSQHLQKENKEIIEENERLRQRLQSEGGLQWVKAATRTPSNEDLVHVRYGKEKGSKATSFYDTEEQRWYYSNGTPMVWHPNLEWLDESSPSTANTEEGAEQSITIEQLAEELNDKRVPEFSNIQPDIWYLSRKHTAEYLLDKYDIIPKVASKEQQIAFAEWVQNRHFKIITKSGGTKVWVELPPYGDTRYPTFNGSAAELYELFLTEIKQQS